MGKALLYTILIFFVTQSAVYFQTNGQFISDWVKNNPEKVQDLNVDEITNALPDKNLKTKFSPAFNSSTAMKKKPNHFNMKRGRLNRPGY